MRKRVGIGERKSGDEMELEAQVIEKTGWPCRLLLTCVCVCVCVRATPRICLFIIHFYRGYRVKIGLVVKNLTGFPTCFFDKIE